MYRPQRIDRVTGLVQDNLLAALMRQSVLSVECIVSGTDVKGYSHAI